jgi:hypothetical protein
LKQAKTASGRQWLRWFFLVREVVLLHYRHCIIATYPLAKVKGGAAAGTKRGVVSLGGLSADGARHISAGL